MQRRYCVGGSIVCALLFCSAAASAQNFPTRPIRIVIPYAVGGSTDVVFRILSPKLFEYFGQQVLIDNRPGGGSTIGMDIAAKALPDGYTLGVANIAFGANPFLMSKMPYDSEKDFAPVTLVTMVTMVLAVHPSVPAHSVKQLIALAKAKPNALTYASAGNASANHLATELFDYMTGIKMLHVPYKGGGPAVVAIVSGETSALFATIPSSLPHFKSGKLVALGVSSARRNAALPDVPSIAEAGVPGYESFEWQGLMAPAGTPRPVIDKLHQEFVKALKLPEMKDRLASLGADPVGSTPDELAAFIKREFATWSKVVKQAGIRLD